MKIILLIYLIQTILGYLSWIKILGSKPNKFIEKLTYLLFSMILMPNLILLIAATWAMYSKIKVKIKSKFLARLKNNNYFCKVKINN